MSEKSRQPNPVMCSRCLHSWVGFYLPLPINDAARIMRNLTCPNCGATSKEIYIGYKPRPQSSAEGGQ